MSDPFTQMREKLKCLGLLILTLFREGKKLNMLADAVDGKQLQDYQNMADKFPLA